MLPLIIDLKKPSILGRHWLKINEITGAKIQYENPDQMFIDDLMKADLLKFQEDIVDICESADKQLKIRQTLDEINEYWNNAYFDFQTWGKIETPCLLAGLKVGEILEHLEED